MFRKVDVFAVAVLFSLALSTAMVYIALLNAFWRS